MKWDGNIKINFKERGYEGKGGVKLVQYVVRNREVN
jgi:hypothetical protein